MRGGARLVGTNGAASKDALYASLVGTALSVFSQLGLLAERLLRVPKARQVCMYVGVRLSCPVQLYATDKYINTSVILGTQQYLRNTALTMVPQKDSRSIHAVELLLLRLCGKEHNDESVSSDSKDVCVSKLPIRPTVNDDCSDEERSA